MSSASATTPRLVIDGGRMLKYPGKNAFFSIHPAFRKSAPAMEKVVLIHIPVIV
jgi:hypothetical protein